MDKSEASAGCTGPQPEPLYRSRPNADAITAAAAPAATEVCPGIWLSPGLSNAYLLTTNDGRIVVNTGMGFEGPVHRANFDAVDTATVRYIILTQGHYDHVGGVDTLRDPETQVIAQSNWEQWRADNDRLVYFRASKSAFAWSSKIIAGIDGAKKRVGFEILPDQSTPTPDVIVHESMTLDVGGRRLELIATPGGETTDSMVIWLPDEEICLCGNIFGALFGHIPNLVTMRGDRYRDALTVIDSIDRIRALKPGVLLTGHFGPIVGHDLIEIELRRLRDALQFVHDQTVAGMNAGHDVRTLMDEVVLPPHLEVGQGYGKVSWNVRAVWENYSGWFHHKTTTELYPTDTNSVTADLAELAGVDSLLDRARIRLDDDQTLQAIQLAEIVINTHSGHHEARALLAEAHHRLLAASTNFWESAWLRQQIAALS